MHCVNAIPYVCRAEPGLLTYLDLPLVAGRAAPGLHRTGGGTSADVILDRFAIEGRVAVVTGAGLGIGRGIALGLAEAGADVVLAARTRSDLEEVATAVRSLGRRALVVPTDVTDASACERWSRARSRSSVGSTSWSTTPEARCPGRPWIPAKASWPARSPST